jgi:hypothetical protein
VFEAFSWIRGILNFFFFVLFLTANMLWADFLFVFLSPLKWKYLLLISFFFSKDDNLSYIIINCS